MSLRRAIEKRQVESCDFSVRKFEQDIVDGRLNRDDFLENWLSTET